MKQNSKRRKYLPSILIQQIRLQWHKDCRGGNAAAQRNQYPRAMQLPKDFFTSYYPFGPPTHFVFVFQSPPKHKMPYWIKWAGRGIRREHK